MSKTLKNVQAFYKVGQVLSTVVFVACIVGLCAVVIGGIGLAFGIAGIRIGGDTLVSIIELNAGVTMNTVYTAMVCAAILCCFELVVSKLAMNYFKHELAAGTPFTMEGSKELFRLGIWTIVLSLVGMFLASMAGSIMAYLLENVTEPDLVGFGSAGLGALFLAISQLCKLGAEQNAAAPNSHDLTAKK